MGWGECKVCLYRSWSKQCNMTHRRDRITIIQIFHDNYSHDEKTKESLLSKSIILSKNFRPNIWNNIYNIHISIIGLINIQRMTTSTTFIEFHLKAPMNQSRSKWNYEHTINVFLMISFNWVNVYDWNRSRWTERNLRYSSKKISSYLISRISIKIP